MLSLCFVFVVLFVLFVGFFFWSFSQLFSSLLSFHFKQRSRKLSDAKENEHHRGYDRKWREFSGPITARRKVNALLETVLQLIKIFSLFLDRNHKTGGSLEWSSVSTKSWHFSKFPSHFFFSLFLLPIYYRLSNHRGKCGLVLGLRSAFTHWTGNSSGAKFLFSISYIVNSSNLMRANLSNSLIYLWSTIFHGWIPKCKHR